MTGVRVFATFLAIWLGIAFVGGIFDGKLIPTDKESSANQIMQSDIVSAGEEGGVTGFLNRVGGFFAGVIDYLVGWANMLALNFSVFSSGPIPETIGWILRLILGGPMIAGLVMARFGGG